MGDFRSVVGRFLIALFPTAFVHGQITTYPFTEHFDSLNVPSLPSGWSTTTNRLSSGDFFSTASSPRSAPNALQSTNSVIAQSLISPAFSFVSRVPNMLEFATSRSSTHTSGFLVEASLDGGNSFSIALADTFWHPGLTGYVTTKLALPASLAQQPSVTFRWRILGGTGGTAGTFRIDDVSISVYTSFDLSLARMSLEPRHPTFLTPVTFSCTLKNLGLFSAAGYTVHFFFDSDKDGNAEPSEEFAVEDGPALTPNDSIEISVTHPPVAPGEHDFIASISYTEDELLSNNELRATASVGVPSGSVVVNEIMYAPAGDEPEWVEVFNTTTSPINLKNWKISDSNVSSKIPVTVSDVLLQPMSYILVAKDSVPHADHGIPLLLGNLPALNNASPDAVVLFDHRGLSIDSVFYSPSWGGRDGKSLERIDELGGSNDPANWTTSVDSLGSTPGRLNSSAKLDYDLAIRRTTVSGTVLTMEIENSGRQPAQGFLLQLFSDFNRNGIPEAPEEIASLPFSDELRPGVVKSMVYEWVFAPQGETAVLVRIGFGPDQRSSNNTVTAFVVRRFIEKSLVINEIAYEPLPGQNEWVEFFHRGDISVDLQHWSLSDKPTGSGRNTFSLSTSSRTIRPGEYILVAADSTILNSFPDLDSSPGAHLIILNRPGGLSFGNDGDDIVLYDLTGSIIDSVSYLPAWHNADVTETRGRSLERINPEIESNDRRNWSTSAGAAGGTPGSRNSLYSTSLPAGSALSLTPNPFSPDGDGFEDVCIIRYHLPFSSSIIRIKIFDVRGRLIRLLADGEPAGSEGEIVWDGFDDQKRRARIGPHIVLLEAVGNQGATGSKAVVVVATKL